MQDIVNEARKNAIVKYPKEPDTDAPLEEHEEYQRKVDAFPDKYDSLVGKESDKIMKREEKRFKKQSLKEQKKEYTDLMINYICQTEINKRFLDMCVYFSTYKDKKFKVQAFENFDDYDNSSGELKDQLRNSYEQLDMGMGDIKKLQEATQ